MSKATTVRLAAAALRTLPAGVDLNAFSRTNPHSISVAANLLQPNYSSLALMLAYQALNNKFQSEPLQIHLIDVSLSSPSESSFVKLMRSLSNSSSVLSLHPNPQPELGNHFLTSLAIHCRQLHISNIATSATLCDLFSMLSSFFGYEYSLESLNENYRRFLLPTAFQKSDSYSIKNIMSQAKPRSSGLFGSNDPSAFTVDVMRPLLGFTDVELMKYCNEHGYIIENTESANTESAKRTNINGNMIAKSSNSNPSGLVGRKYVEQKLVIRDVLSLNRHKMGVDFISNLLRKRVKIPGTDFSRLGIEIPDVTSLNSGDFNLERDRCIHNLPVDLDFADVVAEISAGLNSYNKKVEKILSQTSATDPPTGSCFLSIETNSDGKLPNSHWLRDNDLAYGVLSNLLEWTVCDNFRTKFERVNLFRQFMLDYYKPVTNNKQAVNQIGDLTILLTAPLRSKKPMYNTNNDHEVMQAHMEQKHRHQNQSPWIITRAPIRHGLRTANNLKIYMKINQVKLWDNRFYVTLRQSKPKTSLEDPDTEKSLLTGIDPKQLLFVVRPFLLADFHKLQDRMHHGIGSAFSTFTQAELNRLKLAHYMRAMPTNARHTIPCVALVQDNGDDSYVISVPGIGGMMTEFGVVDIKISFLSEAWKGVKQMREELQFENFISGL
ncbi:hypothetical protein HK100_001044 [Physocladia obscura]|uniref:Uncharacterized protein n=1 Tax=Physocladia obscura TaxID=109957 RepID=A0AAD5SYF9_9FUNG|nr:hypothetical protein HK100_001044 [Physocladia obscura]